MEKVRGVATGALRLNMGRVHAMPSVTTRGSRKARILENSSSQPIYIRHKDNDFLTSKVRGFVENANTFVEHQARSKKN